jgi:uncharacterized protein (TIGR02145 family)
MINKYKGTPKPYRSRNKKRVVMNKRIFKISVLIVSMAIVFGSCSKDDNDPSSGNATNGKTTAVFNPDLSYGTLTDQDGNTYKTITIGTQTWMAENLRTINYNDGTVIPNITDADEWAALTTGAYCNYNNTTGNDTIATYGRLYNWYAINTGKLAPKGWHVPTNAEWTTLTDYLGGTSVAGGKLKETGITHWGNPNIGATNESGFTALPGSFRYPNGAFDYIGIYGIWWSSTEGVTDYAYGQGVDNSISNLTRIYNYKELGYSVRCLKD